MKRFLTALLLGALLVSAACAENAAPVFNFGTRTVQLNNSRLMPILGLGTWTLDDDETENAVYHALADGYRLIDTAAYYGNQTGVGKGVRKAIAEGIVTREEVFVTTKIAPWNTDGYAEEINACNEELGLNYIDLMLIHQRGVGEKALYAAIEDAIDAGIVRSLGISNYYTPDEFDFITEDARYLPTVIQNENHPFYQNTALQDYVSRWGTVVESYYPFGGRGHTQDLFQHDTITAIAQAHGKTSAQVLGTVASASGIHRHSRQRKPRTHCREFQCFRFRADRRRNVSHCGDEHRRTL